MQSLCDYVVKIPTRFSVNLGVAGALIMYDRLLSLGRHAPRPVAEGAPTEAVELPVFGEPMYKRQRRARAPPRHGMTPRGSPRQSCWSSWWSRLLCCI